MLKQVIDTFEILDSPAANGEAVKQLFEAQGETNIEIKTVEGHAGTTDFIKIKIKGQKGKSNGGDVPTVGIIGRLGGVGARPEMTGFVSDGDGAWIAIASALKLSKMHQVGDVLKGDVIICTHICANSPTVEHFPVPFMGAPVSSAICNQYEVDTEMDMILSIDTTKGNKFINHRGFAVSPTVKDGYILKVSDDILEVMMRTTGKMPVVFPLSQQDISPYGNGLFHMNSILQPSVVTDKPVIGVAITAETPVAGCDTGASHPFDIEQTVRFVIEVAKDVGEERCKFFDQKEYDHIQKIYGSQSRFRTMGDQVVENDLD